MADISTEELRKEITAVLKNADLTTMSAKRVRQQVEEKLKIELLHRKKEVDDLVMQCLKEDGKKGDKKKNGSKKKDDDDAEDGDEDDEEDEEEDEEDEEDDEKPAKRAANKKPAPVKRKASSEESEEDEDKESDEEYSPSKKAKGRPKGKGGKGRKKKGSDSDSDEDWGKGKKSGAKKGGGGGAKRGYTKVCTLSPELAAVVGQDAMARHEVVKKVWAIIKEKNLYDPKNKQYAICNDELLKVFGVKRFRTFGMMKFLKNHFVD